jgi:hypothetical protein
MVYEGELLIMHIPYRLTKSQIDEINERSIEIINIEMAFDKNRQIEKEFPDECRLIDLIDSNVSYEIETAISSYKISSYNAVIIFLGVAIEEELARLYLLIEKKAFPKEFGGQNLLEWAIKKGIAKSHESPELLSLITGRNYFAHAHRVIRDKTRAKLKDGKIDGIMPISVEIPEFFKEIVQFMEKSTGEKYDYNEPKIGWLNSKECAIKCLEIVTSFVCRTSNDYKSDDVLFQIETHIDKHGRR